MLISIWGRDGCGKSTLADYIGQYLSKKDITVLIDTDLTQPTLPMRLPGLSFRKDSSLGKAIAGTGTTEIRPYLFHHLRQEGLFIAGLTYGDDCMSYELGLETEATARLFVKNCQEQFDQVILDCSGQRTDPFLPAALQLSDKIILMLMPEPQGILWWQSAKPLLEKLNVMDKIELIMSPIQPHHEIRQLGKDSGLNIKVALPFAPELNHLRCSGHTIDDLVTRQGRSWQSTVRQLVSDLNRRGDVSE